MPFLESRCRRNIPFTGREIRAIFLCHHRLTDKYGSCSVLQIPVIRRVGIRHNDRACGRRRRGPAGIGKCASRFPVRRSGAGFPPVDINVSFHNVLSVYPLSFKLTAGPGGYSNAIESKRTFQALPS